MHRFLGSVPTPDTDSWSEVYGLDGHADITSRHGLSEAESWIQRLYDDTHYGMRAMNQNRSQLSATDALDDGGSRRLALAAPHTTTRGQGRNTAHVPRGPAPPST